MTNGRLRPVNMSGGVKRPKCKWGPKTGRCCRSWPGSRRPSPADFPAEGARRPVDVGSDLEHDLVAAEVRQRFRGHQLVRSRVRLAVLDGDDGPIGDREHICSLGVELLVRGALPLIPPVALEEGPVYGKRLGGLDAATV